MDKVYPEVYPRKGDFVSVGGEKVQEMRRAFAKVQPDGKMNQSEFGRLVSEALGGPSVAAGQVSDWENGEPGRYVLAALAWVHPTDPRGCLEWFSGKRDHMPDIPAVDLPRNDETVRERLEREATTSTGSESALAKAKKAERKRGQKGA